MPLCGGRRASLPARPSTAVLSELQTSVGCSKSDVIAIYERFRKLAPTGFLTLGKFEECLGLLGSIGKILSDCMFMAFDRNGDGYLDFVEYASAVLTMLHGSDKKRMELSYRIVCTTTGNLYCKTHRSSRDPLCDDSMTFGGCIDINGFQDLVKDITATKSVLLGHRFEYFNTAYIARIFDEHASYCDDGVKRISQQDFIRAIESSSDFVELLGSPAIKCAVEASMPSRAYESLTNFVRNRTLMRSMSDDRFCRRSKTYINRTNAQRNRHFSKMATKESRVEATKVGAFPNTRRGLAVYFGHERWNDVINVMIALGLSARRVSKDCSSDLKEEHFKEKRVFSISPNTNKGMEASLNYVEQGSEGFDALNNPQTIIFTEYAPLVFKQLRKLMNLSEEEYIESVGPEHLVGNMVLGNLSTLSELVSEGKSGALFYFTANGRLVLKTLTTKCAAFVQEWLPEYYRHILNHPNSLIARFIGLFSMTTSKTRNSPTYFLVMNNVFYSTVAMHRRYDLKGSWIGRSVPANERKDHTVALKDCDMQDLKEFIELDQRRVTELTSIIATDVDFLVASSLLDYSLLLGIHYRSQSEDDVDWVGDVDHTKQPFIMGKGRDRLYFIGIIDVLTRWDFAKRAEGVWRRLQTFNSAGVSCVNPQQYGKRFIDYIKNRIS
ncbi:phosphatidylinositol-4-phosphate 5-kinase [Babesia gibsoni]|uniref:Phosphatidylinositol-4-phosphate 5-kinase n=1 Tax=Babesia gibsoni TaxID=33632 RepID=A0AAD8URZ0_BABGI|nr:phosphatidylinositol-4-phosphate 5-kinase [Babesia gibsoni]